jgi:predicted O-methyltransferase YrrM
MQRDLQQTYIKIATFFDLPVVNLMKYANEDEIPGKHEGNPLGTEYNADGQLLYAFVRLLQPLRILEIGTDRGGSAIHMIEACKRNGRGHVTTIDINPNTGDGLTAKYSTMFTKHICNANEWIPNYSGVPFDFIFEDGSHSEYQVHVIYQNLRKILQPGGFILSHDTNTGVGLAVKNGIRKGGAPISELNGNNEVFLCVCPPSFLGFSIYQFNEATYGNE